MDHLRSRRFACLLLGSFHKLTFKVLCWQAAPAATADAAAAVATAAAVI